DRLEFNDAFRWIDTMADLALLAMDLMEKGRADQSTLLINAYLDYTGDYQGLVLLPYYLAYRAMVRAKVSLFRLQQSGLSTGEREQVQAEYQHFIALAGRYAQSPQPMLVITHGV